MDMFRGCMGPSSPLGGPFRKAIGKRCGLRCDRCCGLRCEGPVRCRHRAFRRAPHPVRTPRRNAGVRPGPLPDSGPEEGRSAVPRRTVVRGHGSPPTASGCRSYATTRSVTRRRPRATTGSGPVGSDLPHGRRGPYWPVWSPACTTPPAPGKAARAARAAPRPISRSSTRPVPRWSNWAGGGSPWAMWRPGPGSPRPRSTAAGPTRTSSSSTRWRSSSTSSNSPTGAACSPTSRAWCSSSPRCSRGRRPRRR